MIDFIGFYHSKDLKTTRQFYEGLLGFKLWKDQGACLIFDLFGHGKIGFCDHFKKTSSSDDCLTFVYERVEDVIDVRDQLMSHGILCDPVKTNPTFKITHFFARDPDGHRIEFQVFLD